MQQSQPQLLRLLSYNIQVGITTHRYGQYLTNSWKHVLPYPHRMETLRAIGEFISAFDIVGMQELDAGSLRSGFVDQTEYLARVGMFPFWYSMTNRHIGHLARHALGLLSRYPAHRIIEHRLPSAIPGRGALEIHFGEKCSPLIIVLLHLSLSRRARRQQFEYVNRIIEQYRFTVIMGDLNCQPDAQEFVQLLENGHVRIMSNYECTYPSWRPAQAYDHILVSPELKIHATQVYPLHLSDHLPVGVVLELPSKICLRPGTRENICDMPSASTTYLPNKRI